MSDVNEPYIIEAGEFDPETQERYYVEDRLGRLYVVDRHRNTIALFWTEDEAQDYADWRNSREEAG